MSMKNENSYFSTKLHAAWVLFSIVLICIFFSCTRKESHSEHDHTASAKAVYTCPMDPEVLSDKPGSCPICKMDLVLEEPVGEEYTCPMHPEIIQDKPGSCPICKMDLVLKQKELVLLQLNVGEEIHIV